ncbi:type III secretion protein [Pseudomonas sp. LRF_L74]|uniref:type III secretion protein n=1 Tax=Pseudomonas sp. LRF_L74 TaxID=3369422 RepID=UPI003F639FAC
MSRQAEQWIEWWFQAGEQAHPGWSHGAANEVAWLDGLPVSRRAARACPEGALMQPPAPDEAVLSWVALDHRRRELALALVGDICLPAAPWHERREPYAGWCRSIGKALRPGLWLGEPVHDPRMLLGAWVGAQCWSRVKLQWSPEGLGSPPAGLPMNRLKALWGAVLWRVARERDDACPA